MKKIMIMFLSILLIGSCFVGCNPESKAKDYDKYTSLVAGIVNDGYSTDLEVDFWYGSDFIKENMEDKTCVVNGVSYSGSYKESTIDFGNSYITDIYKDEKYIEFGLKSNTGELVCLNLKNAEFYATEPYLPDVSDPQETAVKIATEIAGEYIHVAEYTRIDKEPSILHKERDGVTYELATYYVTFAKKVNGYLSSDHIVVGVTSKGHLASIRIGDINAFDDVTLDFDEDVVNQSISDKIVSAYQEKNIGVQNMQIEDQMIVVSPTGDIGMYSYVTFDMIYPSDDIIGTAIEIFTSLGRKGQ